MLLLNLKFSKRVARRKEIVLMEEITKHRFIKNNLEQSKEQKHNIQKEFYFLDKKIRTNFKTFKEFCNNRINYRKKDFVKQKCIREMKKDFKQSILMSVRNSDMVVIKDCLKNHHKFRMMEIPEIKIQNSKKKTKPELDLKLFVDNTSKRNKFKGKRSINIRSLLSDQDNTNPSLVSRSIIKSSTTLNHLTSSSKRSKLSQLSSFVMNLHKNQYRQSVNNQARRRSKSNHISLFIKKKTRNELRKLKSSEKNPTKKNFRMTSISRFSKFQRSSVRPEGDKSLENIFSANK